MKKSIDGMMSTIIGSIIIYILLTTVTGFVMGAFSTITSDVVLIVTDIANILTPLILLKLFNKKYDIFKHPTYKIKKEWCHIVFITVGLIAVGMAIAIVFAYLMPPEAPAEEAYYSLENATNKVLFLVTLCIIGPVSEEIIFRGIIYKACRECKGFLVSAVISSALWGVAHFDLQQGITVFIVGIILAAVVEKYGDIRVAMAIHMLNNLFAMVMESLLIKYNPDMNVKLIVIVIASVVIGGLFIWIGLRHKPVLDETECNSILQKGVK